MAASRCLVAHRESGKLLCIGLGTGSLVQMLRRQLPLSVSIDVVELNRSVIEAAQQHCGFDLDSGSSVHVQHGDALCWLKRNLVQYDTIHIDAYDADGVVPPHLASDEFFQALTAALAHQGAIVANVTNKIDAIVKLCKTVFRHVLVLEAPGGGYLNQVLVVLPSAEKTPDIKALLENSTRNTETLARLLQL